MIYYFAIRYYAICLITELDNPSDVRFIQISSTFFISASNITIQLKFYQFKANHFPVLSALKAIFLLF